MALIHLDYDLLNLIIASDLRAGDRLPAINELQSDDHLGIGINKVREQLEVARALGLVEVKSKTGTRVKPYSFTPAVQISLLFAIARDQRAFELFSEVRNHLEVAFWVEACALLTDEDLAVMRGCLENARAKLTEAQIRIPYEEHRTFHLTVFKRLDNPFVMGLLEAYWAAYDAVELNRYSDYTYLQQVWGYHERIFQAICDRRFDDAKTLFIEHTQLLRHHPVK